MKIKENKIKESSKDLGLPEFSAQRCLFSVSEKSGLWIYVSTKMKPVERERSFLMSLFTFSYL